MTLQQNLDSLKNTKLPYSTTFGNLQSIVPVPYSQFDNLDNPRPTYKESFINYQPMNIQKELSANTRTDLSKIIFVDELNFQAYRGDYYVKKHF
jgi:hypothetical protein